MRLLIPALLCAAMLGDTARAGEAGRKLPVLAPPVKIMAADKPIAVEVGHAMPFVVDWNKDGKKDLLVGQFGGGKCRVYLNVGADATPRFDRFTWLQANGADAAVPPS